MNYLHPIHFTLAEAQAMLQEVLPIVQRLRTSKQELESKGYDIRSLKYLGGGVGTNGTQPYPDEVHALIEDYRELHTRGVLVKEIDAGLIDFPAIRSNGEEVYLCYKLGEPSIMFWHAIEDGFAGRQSIDTL